MLNMWILVSIQACGKIVASRVQVTFDLTLDQLIM